MKARLILSLIFFTSLNLHGAYENYLIKKASTLICQAQKRSVFRYLPLLYSVVTALKVEDLSCKLDIKNRSIEFTGTIMKNGHKVPIRFYFGKSNERRS